MTTADQRNYLEEALQIINGSTLLEPERNHLIALNESRVSWRNSYWSQSKNQTAASVARAKAKQTA